MDHRHAQICSTPVGISVLWIAVAAIAGGGLLFSAPLLLAGLLLLGVWFLVRKVALLHLSGIQVHRPLPPRAWVGRSFAVEAEIENVSGSPAASHFLLTDPIAVSPSASPLTLSAGTDETRVYAAKCHRRGRYQSPNWKAKSLWPLGWFESEQTGFFSLGTAEAESILVLPSPFLPPQLQNHLDGLLTSAALWNGLPDPTAEFRLLREFRHGDAVRRIHWPASLKSGDLLVRESDPPHPLPLRYGILIHSFLPQKEIVTPETFEMILRIASGLLYRFREAGIEIQFQHLPSAPVLLRHREDFDRELDRLGLVVRSPIATINPVLETAATFDRCDEVFVIGDADRVYWESETAMQLPCSTCIDAKSLTLAARPAFKRSPRLAS